MSNANLVPDITSVLHPTDFSKASDQAFVHALAVALVRQTRLTILHAGKQGEDDWSSFPPVRRTLERWGLLEPGSPRSAPFDQLSLRVSKVAVSGDPVRATLQQVEKQAADLVVLATEGRDGIARFLRPSVGQWIGRRSNAMGAMTLFVPADAQGFVRPEDGQLNLRRILVPVDRTPDASPVLVRAARLAEILGDGDVQMTVLHVGDEVPVVAPPQGEGFTCTTVARSGEVVPEILAAAEEVDLIVMPTDGRSGVLDALRGSFTERIVREATCPVLAVPSA